MSEQSLLREGCHSLEDKLGNEDEEKLSVASDLESILTFYCKSCNVQYERDNGWLDILQPMLALKLSKADLYNSFYAMLTRYIPRECCKNGKPFHLFRLLLLYHDPELCSFLDTRKITPDTYALTWFQSLFGATCDLDVILNMWDVYLQTTDPFLVFFLALVILVNAKEQIMTMEKDSKEKIIDKLSMFPCALEAEDIEDFCQLAQYYANRTPQSFRRDYQNPLFGTSLAAQKHDAEVQISQALCLPVAVEELLQANQNAGVDNVRYFVVDCRPADMYNSGHLSIAFHLDANLMLHNPTEFATAVQALFATQRLAIASGSVAGGEHLCFMGSGREEEDQFVNMVVSNFLQKNTQYVSIARGGFTALEEVLGSESYQNLSEPGSKLCITSNPEASAAANSLANHDSNGILSKGDTLLGKLSSAVKTKSAIMKEKLTNYIKNEQVPFEGHVSSSDRVGKRYRNMASVFTIGDDEEDEIEIPSSDDERREIVNIETWVSRSDMQYACQCQEVKDNGTMCPSHLLVTASHMFVLREIPNRKGMAWIQQRRPLAGIVKITSKNRHPELITFKYGTNDDDELKITDLDRFLIPKASEATKAIKTQIMKVLDAMDS